MCASRCFALAGALLLTVAPWGRAAPAAAAGKPEVRVPAVDAGVDTLAARAQAQREAAAGLKLFTGFRFQDRQPESGITFVQRPTDDSGKFYKAVHYDHGNGLAAADVDGDGRIDLYFVNQLGGNELWKNVGNGKFRNVTREAGVAVEGRVSVAASFADIDNDGDPDLYVTTVRQGNVLFVNEGKGRFRDISKASGLDYVGHSSGAVFFDYDRDGRLDLFLVNVGKYTGEEKGAGGYFVGYADAFSGHRFPERTEYSRLYRNAGGNRFEDVSQRMNLRDASWSGDASAVDLNEDGFLDLYVLNMQGDNHYYENQKGERFVDRTEAHFPKTPWGAMGIKFFDWDNDGKIDLILTDMHSDMSHEIGPEEEKQKSRMEWTDEFLQGGANNVFGNAFLHNRGNGRFEEVSDRIGVENYWPWGVSVGDVNADAFEDVFIGSGMGFPFRYGINSLLLNDAGRRFQDAEFLLGIEPRRGGVSTAPFFDVDCGKEGAGRPACAGRKGTITVLGTLSTRAAVIFDLEGDGDLDIVTSEFAAAPQVLVSDLAQRRPVRFLQVTLVGGASNRDGLGSRVTVTSGGRAYTKWNDGKSGYLSQSVLPLYIGLGDSPVVERVEVLWPSGRRSVVDRDIRINRTLTVAEPR
jgi:hypothetical protein